MEDEAHDVKYRVRYLKINAIKELLNNNDYEVFRHVGVAFIIRVSGAFSAFIASMILTRRLGSEESGYYFLAFSVITFVAALSRIGLDQAVLRHTGAAYPLASWRDIASILRKATLLAGMASLLTATLLWVSADWFAYVLFDKPQMGGVLRHMAPAIVFVALMSLVAMSLQGIRRVKSSIFTLSISANVILILLLLFGQASQASQAAQYFSIASFVAVIIGIVLWRRHHGISHESEITSWNVLLGGCFPLWTIVLMNQLVLWSGQLVAGSWVGASELSMLAVSQRTAMLGTFILAAVNFVVAPRIAAMYRQGDIEGIQSLSLVSVRTLVVVSFPIFLLMVVYAEGVMSLFGTEYQSAAPLLQVLSIGQFVNVATGSVGILLTMSGHERDLRNVTLVSGSVSVVAAFTLTPIFGVLGSAAATAFAVSIHNLLAVLFVKKRLGFNMLLFWRYG